jgi:hypothetical protein
MGPSSSHVTPETVKSTVPDDAIRRDVHRVGKAAIARVSVRSDIVHARFEIRVVTRLGGGDGDIWSRPCSTPVGWGKGAIATHVGDLRVAMRNVSLDDVGALA